MEGRHMADKQPRGVEGSFRESEEKEGRRPIAQTSQDL